jgi:hypothetical protein
MSDITTPGPGFGCEECANTGRSGVIQYTCVDQTWYCDRGHRQPWTMTRVERETDFPALYNAIGAALRDLPAGNYALTLNPDDWPKFPEPDRDAIAVAVDPGFPHFHPEPDPPPPGERVGMAHGHNVYLHPAVARGDFRIDPLG